MKFFKTHKKWAASGAILVAAIVASTAAYAYFSSPGSGAGGAQAATTSPVEIHQLGTAMYKSTDSPINYPHSQCFYCVGMGEFGNEINLANGGGPLSDVVVGMSNFGTTTGNMTMTMKIFNPGPGGAGSVPGSLIASDTQTFSIPATSTGYQSTLPWPYGIAKFHITFDFTSQNIVLPGTVVYELQYNDPQNSVTGGVNPELVNESTQVTVGSDAALGYLFASLASTVNGDGYTAVSQDFAPGEISCSTGTTTFQELSTASCLSDTEGYGSPALVPAVEFDSSTISDLYPGDSAQPLNFSLTNNSATPETVNDVTITIAADAGNGYVVESIPGDTGSDVAGMRRELVRHQRHLLHGDRRGRRDHPRRNDGGRDGLCEHLHASVEFQPERLSGRDNRTRLHVRLTVRPATGVLTPAAGWLGPWSGMAPVTSVSEHPPNSGANMFAPGMLVDVVGERRSR